MDKVKFSFTNTFKKKPNIKAEDKKILFIDSYNPICEDDNKLIETVQSIDIPNNSTTIGINDNVNKSNESIPNKNTYGLVNRKISNKKPRIKINISRRKNNSSLNEEISEFNLKDFDIKPEEEDNLTKSEPNCDTSDIGKFSDPIFHTEDADIDDVSDYLKNEGIILEETVEVDRKRSKKRKGVKRKFYCKMESIILAKIIKHDDKSLIDRCGKIFEETYNRKYCKLKLSKYNIIEIKRSHLVEIDLDEFKKSINHLNDKRDLENKTKLNEVIEPKWVHRNLLERQLYSNLIVKIIDKDYEGGKYFNDIVMIEDAYDIDECICRLDNTSSCISGIKSKMLDIVKPDINQYARVMSGEYKNQILFVKEFINSDIVKLWNENEAEDVILPVDIICCVNIS